MTNSQPSNEDDQNLRDKTDRDLQHSLSHIYPASTPHPDSLEVQIDNLIADFYVETHKGRPYADIHDGDLDKQSANLLRKKILKLTHEYYSNKFLEIIDNLHMSIYRGYGQVRKSELKQAIKEWSGL